MLNHKCTQWTWTLVAVLISLAALIGHHAHAAPTTDAARFKELVAALHRLEQRRPPLRGLIQCIVSKNNLNVEAPGETKYRGRFFRSGEFLRMDYLPTDFQDSLAKVAPESISSTLIARDGRVLMAAHVAGPGAAQVNVYEGSSPQADASQNQLRVDLRNPLNMQVEVGSQTVAEILQLDTAEVKFPTEDAGKVRVTASKPSQFTSPHEIVIDLDPNLGYCATFVSDKFRQGDTDAFITFELEVESLADGSYAVRQARQTEHLTRPGKTLPTRTTLYRFSDLQLGEIDDSMFSIDSLKGVAHETLVIDVPSNGEQRVREQVVGPSTKPSVPGAGAPYVDEGAGRTRVLVSAAAILTILIAWFLWRRREAKRNARRDGS